MQVLFILFRGPIDRQMRHSGAYPPLKGGPVHVREPAHFTGVLGHDVLAAAYGAN